MFKDLVASGPHIFNLFYKEVWVPRFGASVLCGLALDNWKFLRPVYPDQPIRCRLVISEVIEHPEKNHARYAGISILSRLTAASFNTLKCWSYTG